MSESVVIVNHLGALLGAAAIGLACVGFGVVLLTDFKGFATWHAKTTAKVMNFSLSPVTPKQLKQRLRWERISGVMFLLFGALFIGLLIVTGLLSIGHVIFG